MTSIKSEEGEGVLKKEVIRKSLSYRTEMNVRFNEADPLGIVWHGHYLRYFEDGREAFGKAYGLSYLDVYQQGFAVPVVSAECHYKKPLRYGDHMIIETTCVNVASAKLTFEYKIFDAATTGLVAHGSTVQVFVDAKTFDLQLTNPDFFENWKKNHLK
ncbi:MAG TPA: acyl-CoA thioesterase [Chryseolinea sp.]|nr:acyl-CoA thioesterase [Chryseolinea sp.]